MLDFLGFGSKDESKTTTSTTSNTSSTSVDIDDKKAVGGDGAIVASEGATITVNNVSGDVAAAMASLATNSLGLANADNTRATLVAQDALMAAARITENGMQLANNLGNDFLAAGKSVILDSQKIAAQQAADAQAAAVKIAADAQRAAAAQAEQAQLAASKIAADAQRAAAAQAEQAMKAAQVLTGQGLVFAENLGTAGLKAGENLAYQNAKLAESISENSLLAAIRMVESQNTLTETTRIGNNNLAQSIAQSAIGVANPAGQLGDQIQQMAKYAAIAAAVIGAALFLRSAAK